MLYLDTSLLVAALANEAETERIQGWLGRQAEGDLAISDWVATEFSSALSIKLRAGHIEPAHRADALGMFARLTTNCFAVVPVSRLRFRTAAGLRTSISWACARVTPYISRSAPITVRPSAHWTGGRAMRVRCWVSRRCCFNAHPFRGVSERTPA